MNLNPEIATWQREGSTVYTLMHHGWSKGEEQFRNRIWFGVYADKDAGVSRDDAAAMIVKAVNSHEQLVAALKRFANLDRTVSSDLWAIRAEYCEAARAALAAAEAA